MQSEVTVTLKGEDSTFKKNFLCYEEIRLSMECPHLREMVNQTRMEFKGEPEEAIVKVTFRYE